LLQYIKNYKRETIIFWF